MSTCCQEEVHLSSSPVSWYLCPVLSLVIIHTLNNNPNIKIEVAWEAGVKTRPVSLAWICSSQGSKCQCFSLD